MANEIRVALVGVGVMGSKYANMIVSGQVKNMVLSGVVARNPQAQEWARALVGAKGQPSVYVDVTEMYEHADEFDAVLIVTPHQTHEEIAVRAFELGKHVLCDKPAGVTIGQAERMTAASEKYNKVYGMIFHQRLYIEFD